eukprot:4065497-Amphidinium_carterae.1
MEVTCFCGEVYVCNIPETDVEVSLVSLQAQQRAVFVCVERKPHTKTLTAQLCSASIVAIDQPTYSPSNNYYSKNSKKEKKT